jgi:hypothetical protein
MNQPESYHTQMKNLHSVNGLNANSNYCEHQQVQQLTNNLEISPSFKNSIINTLCDHERSGLNFEEGKLIALKV